MVGNGSAPQGEDGVSPLDSKTEDALDRAKQFSNLFMDELQNLGKRFGFNPRATVAIAKAELELADSVIVMLEEIDRDDDFDDSGEAG